jgi:hypothetical protein
MHSHRFRLTLNDEEVMTRARSPARLLGEVCRITATRNRIESMIRVFQECGQTWLLICSVTSFLQARSRMFGLSFLSGGLPSRMVLWTRFLRNSGRWSPAAFFLWGEVTPTDWITLSGCSQRAQETAQPVSVAALPCVSASCHRARPYQRSLIESGTLSGP